MNREEFAKAMHGARVELQYMDDVSAPPPGTKGTVMHVDALGQIHVNWDNGSQLALIPGEDVFSFL